MVRGAPPRRGPTNHFKECRVNYPAFFHIIKNLQSQIFITQYEGLKQVFF
jgi:hypothetical protein